MKNRAVLVSWDVATCTVAESCQLWIWWIQSWWIPDAQRQKVWGRERKNERKERGGGEVRLFALTSNPGVIKLIRGIGKELYCRLMGVLASGLLVTWTKSSSVRQKVRKGGSQSVRQFPLPLLPPSALSDMKAVEDWGLIPTQSIEGVGVGGEGWLHAK